MKKRVSIVISAFNAKDYIKECILSVNNQSYFENNTDYEILLGIDECESTLSEAIKLKDRIPNLKLFYFEENNGPYVVFNTLIGISYGEYVSVFGADDIMLNNFISDNILEIKSPNDFVIARGNNFNHPHKNKVVKTYNPDGVILFNRESFLSLNGYEGWRCAADSDLKVRMGIAGFNCIYSKKVTYLRRLHNKSITNSKTHGFKTRARLKLKDIINSRDISRIDKFKTTKKYKTI